MCEDAKVAFVEACALETLNAYVRDSVLRVVQCIIVSMNVSNAGYQRAEGQRMGAQ